MGSADKNLMKSDTQLHWTVLLTKVGSRKGEEEDNCLSCYSGDQKD